MYRVLFFPSGIGMGHVTRSLRVAGELSRSGKVRIFFATYNEPYHVAKSYFPTLRSRIFDFPRTPDGSISYRDIALHPVHFFLHYFESELDALSIIRAINPHFVLIDNIPYVANAINIRRGPPYIYLANILKLRFTDKPESHYSYPVKLLYKAQILIDIGQSLFLRRAKSIAVPDLPPPYTLSERMLLGMHPSAYRKVKFVGPILPDFPRAPQDKLKQEFGFEPDKPLIYVGISGPAEERSALLKKMDAIVKKIPPKYNVIYSRGIPSKNPPTRVNNILIFDWLPDRTKALKACDIYIGRAGAGSLFEAIALGKKIITIPARNQIEQNGNAKRIEELGAGIMLRENLLSYATLLSSIKKAESLKINKNLVKIARKYNGRKILASMILSYLHK